MLSEATAGPILLSAMTSNGLLGSSANTLSNAIISALSTFLPTLVVQTTASGVLGAGTGTGTWVLEPISGSQTLTVSLASNGIVGSAQGQLATSVATGVAQAVSSFVRTQTVVTGVSTGIETGVVLNCNPILLTSLLIGASGGKALLGSSIPQLSRGLAEGLCTWFSTGVVNGLVVGTPTPPFNTSVGTGIGSLV